MPAIIADLLRGKPDLVSTTTNTNIKDVLAEMIKYDYSQLPVIDDNGSPIGLITSDSIVRALHNFSVKTDGLRVKDAMVKRPATYYVDDEVFDLLDDLETAEVVLVIDANNKLIGIITTYDTTAYLRQRAEDIMVVREVEEMVKSYINAAFMLPGGTIDIQLQKTAISDITPSNSSSKGKFRKALEHYLSPDGKTKPAIDQTLLDEAFTKHLYDKPSIKPFDKLALGEYIHLFLHQSRWPNYSKVFSIDREALRHLLDAVRQTRNALAHFRDDITPQQREELRFCKEWLARHEKEINNVFSIANGSVVDAIAPPQTPSNQTNGTISTPTHTTQSQTNSTESPLTSVHEAVSPENSEPDDTIPPGPLDEAPESLSGRYAPLVRHLLEQPALIEQAAFSFDDIDKLLGEHQLPESARKYRAWWANDSVSHSHSQQWLEAGWRVANINMAEERVVFARISDHEQAYLQFFTTLQQELERRAPGLFHFASSGGAYWLTLDNVRVGNKRVGWFYCAFTRTKRFRIELYLDTYVQETTKQLFDALAEHKEAIETELGDKLSWERLDANQPSRIARYYPGTITDTTGALSNLRARAVEAAIRFVPVLRNYLKDVIPEVLGSDVIAPIAEQEKQ